MNIREMMLKLKQVAAGEGLPFGERTMTYNSRMAQELGKWAEDQGKGDAFHHAAFKAYFEEGRNIAQEGVLMEMAVRAALDPKEAQKIMRQRAFSEAVDDDWRRAFELDIRAVPTFLMGGRRLVGAQSYDVLERFVVPQGS